MSEERKNKYRAQEPEREEGPGPFMIETDFGVDRLAPRRPGAEAVQFRDIYMELGQETAEEKK